MIKTKNYGVKAEFGTGDIHMFSGYDSDAKKGTLYLENHGEPHEIGTMSDDYMAKRFQNKILDESKMPCIMTFTKTESIDALIRQLEITKQCMVDDGVLNPIANVTVIEENMQLLEGNNVQQE